MRSAPRVAMVVERARVLAVVQAAGDPDARTLREETYDPEVPSGLADALDAVVSGLPSAAVSVAIQPPLGELRSLGLPPMTPGDLARHLERSGRRYLPGPSARLLAAPVPGRAPGTHALADAGVVETIFGRLEAAGHRAGPVLPAPVFWSLAGAGDEEGAVVRVASARGGAAVRIASAPGGAAVLHLITADEGGRPLYRRFPDSPAGRRALGSACPPGPRPSEEAASALAARPVVEDAAAFTVECMLRATGTGEGMIPADVRAQRARRHRLGALRIGTAAAVVLLLAGAAYPLGLQRELTALREQRADLAAPVGAALEVRTRVERLRGATEVVDRLENGATRWAVTLSEVARALPATAHLTSFRGAADTLALEGRGRNAAEAFQGLRSSELIGDLRASAPVRRESRPGVDAVESFSLTAFVRPSGAAEPPPPSASPDSGGDR